MGTDMLNRLLDEAAADVPAPSLAAPAWERARRIRRRRRAVAAAAVAGLAVATVALLPIGADRRTGPPTAVATGSAAVPSGTTTGVLVPRGVDRLPATLARRAGLPLPATAPDFGKLQAVPLSQRPVARAVALYQGHEKTDAGGPQPVYVWGSDSRWRRLDVVTLDYTRDEAGNEAVPLRSTALSPDGTMAAFAQRDELVVVNLAKATVLRHPVPGFNEDVVWLAADSVIVGQDGGASTVGVFSRSVTRLPAAPAVRDVVADPGAARPLTEMASGNGPAGPSPLTIRRWRADAPEQPQDIQTGDFDGTSLSQWHGRGVRNGDLVVRGGWGQSRHAGSELVGVVDLRTSAVVRLLDVGGDRTKGCCTPLAWLDATTILLRTDREGIVAWNAATGTVEAVSGPFDGTISVTLPPAR